MEDIDVSDGGVLQQAPSPLSTGLTIPRLVTQLFDVNEAFAAQWLAVAKELGLPMDRSNVNGGAIGELCCVWLSIKHRRD